MLFVQFKQAGTAVQPHHLVNDVKAMFPDASQGPNLKAKPSKDNSLREAVLALSANFPTSVGLEPMIWF